MDAGESNLRNFQIIIIYSTHLKIKKCRRKVNCLRLFLRFFVTSINEPTKSLIMNTFHLKRTIKNHHKHCLKYRRCYYNKLIKDHFEKLQFSNQEEEKEKRKHDAMDNPRLLRKLSYV